MVVPVYDGDRLSRTPEFARDFDAAEAGTDHHRVRRCTV
jgi:hypothetical protein